MIICYSLSHFSQPLGIIMYRKTVNLAAVLCSSEIVLNAWLFHFNRLHLFLFTSIQILSRCFVYIGDILYFRTFYESSIHFPPIVSCYCYYYSDFFLLFQLDPLYLALSFCPSLLHIVHAQHCFQIVRKYITHSANTHIRRMWRMKKNWKKTTKTKCIRINNLSILENYSSTRYLERRFRSIIKQLLEFMILFSFELSNCIWHAFNLQIQTSSFHFLKNKTPFLLFFFFPE